MRGGGCRETRQNASHINGGLNGLHIVNLRIYAYIVTYYLYI